MNPSVTDSRRARRIVLCIVLLAGTLLLLTGMAFAALPNSLPNRQHRVINSCPVGYTICSVQSGDWDDPTTWSPPRIPTTTDKVGIGHIVTIPANNSITIMKLNVGPNSEGSLYLGPGEIIGICDINIVAANGIDNAGFIQGGVAGDRGCNVILRAPTGQINHTGMIQAGDAPDGLNLEGFGAAGGDVELTAHSMYLRDTIGLDFVRAGQGGDSPATGGAGGDVTINADGEVIFDHGQLLPGLGGTPNGACGNLILIGTPLTLLPRGQVGVPCGGLWLDPHSRQGDNSPDILVRGATLVGATINIYGPAGWEIAFKPAPNGLNPVISATHGITVTAGPGGSLDFSQVTADIFQVADPGGTVSFQADAITSTLPLTDLVGTDTPVTVAPSIAIYAVEVLGVTEGELTTVVGQPYTMLARVQNTSSVSDTFDVQIQAPGWTVDPANISVGLDIFEIGDIPITVIPNSSGQQILIINATSQTQPDISYDAAQVVLHAFAACPAISNFDFSVSGQAAFGAIRPGTPATFQVMPQSTGWNLAWEFGDGATRSGDVIQHTFNIPGVYNITLTAGNDCGNSRSVTHPLSVFYSAGLPIIFRR